MTIEELINKLSEKSSHEAARELEEKLAGKKVTTETKGTYGLLRFKLEEYTKKNKDEDYYFILGMLWGLYECDFISEEERKELLNELMNLH